MPKIVVAGGRGVVGRQLIEQAGVLGWDVTLLTRTAGKPLLGASQVSVAAWRPAEASLGEAGAVSELASALEGADVVVNLAGESLMNGRLGSSHLQRVTQSRVDSVNAVGQALAACDKPPPVWLQASAVGYYGDTGETSVTEKSPIGSGVLAEVCRVWEGAANTWAAKLPHVRLCIMRIGVVFAPEAEAWKRMLLPIKLGAGGPLGSGMQWYGWVSGRDLARAFFFVAADDSCQGVFNVTAPEAVRQKEIVQSAASKLGRPALLPTPAFALRAALGKHVANEMILSSCRADPDQLTKQGFQFEMRSFQDALPWLLG
ncbi:MAG: TIGR01777 family oxidoreductase [Myxococcota bacterium]|nr:TIGR01777 family oxidoreductase [Myxococcota bacterium]